MSSIDHFQLGQAAQKAGRIDEALAQYKAALKADIDNFAAAQMLGLLLLHRKDFVQAEIYLTHAAQLNDRAPQVQYALGLVHAAQGRPGDSLLAYERALALKPDFIEAMNNRGTILQETILRQDALECFERVLALKPDSAQAKKNRDALLARSENRPAFSALGYFNLGFALRESKRHAAALAAYDMALRLDPSLPYVPGERLNTKMEICDWRGYETERSRILSGVEKGQAVSWPFQLLTITSDLDVQLKCARNFVADKFPAKRALSSNTGYGHSRPRIAYMSSDFRNHPVGILIAGIIENHDRGDFEVFGISTGADDGSQWRKKLSASFDRFLNGRQMNDDDIAAGIRDLEIDILIDLNGDTVGARAGVLAQRPAPIQLNFLGYAGTMGADYMDYILADRTLIPPQDEIHYAEKIAAMPLCYLPCAAPGISAITSSRKEHGLPESGFVFCAFNSSFKITPEIFGVWMRLLEKLPGSALWLREPGEPAKNNLLGAARAENIDDKRLVFARPMRALEDHLARHKLADLFLDTLPYNAHSTAADALWSGLPVLTCSGGSYASRVSASLLTALGLQDLITGSLEEYENLALALARDPARLAALKEKLNQTRVTSGLFDNKRFTRDLENAYRAMLARLETGLVPASFDVVG
jgi:predicted O-linked N-acetylglucosamine transferase (SPINDLY family)